MDGIALNVAIGAVGSIVATVILYFLSTIYTVGYKKDFKFALNNAYTAVYQIENLHSFSNDYPLVISQIDYLNQCAFTMYRSLSFLSLWSHPNSKKLIITLLNDIVSFCEISKFTTVGLSGENEWLARLEMIERYFYKYPPLEDKNCSTVRVQLDIISKLIEKKSICESIRYAFGNLSNSTQIGNLATDGFIQVKSFKQESHNIGLREHCFTECQLEKILRKEMR